MTPPDNEFGSGAVRSADAEGMDFTSLPLIGLLAVARTTAEGAAKYGRFNYLLGMPAHDLLNHAMRHIVLWLLGDRSESHLGHAAWGVLAAIQSDILDPAINAPHLLGPGATLTPAVRSHLAETAAVFAERRRTIPTQAPWKLADLPEIAAILAQREKAYDKNLLPVHIPPTDKRSLMATMRRDLAEAGVVDKDIKIDPADIYSPAMLAAYAKAAKTQMLTTPYMQLVGRGERKVEPWAPTEQRPTPAERNANGWVERDGDDLEVGQFDKEIAATPTLEVGRDLQPIPEPGLCGPCFEAGACIYSNGCLGKPSPEDEATATEG